MDNVWGELMDEEIYWTYDEVIYNYLNSIGEGRPIIVIPDIEFDVN